MLIRAFGYSKVVFPSKKIRLKIQIKNVLSNANTVVTVTEATIFSRKRSFFAINPIPIAVATSATMINISVWMNAEEMPLLISAAIPAHTGPPKYAAPKEPIKSI